MELLEISTPTLQERPQAPGRGRGRSRPRGLVERSPSCSLDSYYSYASGCLKGRIQLSPEAAAAAAAEAIHFRLVGPHPERGTPEAHHPGKVVESAAQGSCAQSWLLLH